jgi:plasmid stabilization system protein ParE
MVEIKWSTLATDDYHSIISYYEKTAPKFAQNLAKKSSILSKILLNFPKWVELFLS